MRLLLGGANGFRTYVPPTEIVFRVPGTARQTVRFWLSAVGEELRPATLVSHTGVALPDNALRGVPGRERPYSIGWDTVADGVGYADQTTGLIVESHSDDTPVVPYDAGDVCFPASVESVGLVGVYPIYAGLAHDYRHGRNPALALGQRVSTRMAYR